MQSALNGECHRHIEIREMRDPTDAVVKHQFVEGGRVYGIFANADIPGHTPLGQYTGHILIDGQRDPHRTSTVDDEDTRKQGWQGRKEQGGRSSHRKPPSRDEVQVSAQSTATSSSRRFGSVGSSPVGSNFEPGSADTESDTESDSDTDDDGQYSLNLPPNPKHPNHKRIYVDSKDHANEMSYINDCRGSGLNSSAEYVGVLCNGVPTVVIVTTRDVKAGEQIYVDYGDASYWNPHEKKKREKAAQVQAMVQEQKEEAIRIKQEQGGEGLIEWTEPVNDVIWQPKSSQDDSPERPGDSLIEEERLLSQSVEGLVLKSNDDVEREDVEAHVRPACLATHPMPRTREAVLTWVVLNAGSVGAE